MLKLRKTEIKALEGDKKALKELQGEQDRMLKLMKYSEICKKNNKKKLDLSPHDYNIIKNQ